MPRQGRGNQMDVFLDGGDVRLCDRNVLISREVVAGGWFVGDDLPAVYICVSQRLANLTGDVSIPRSTRG